MRRLRVLRDERGFTLPELLIATVVLALVMGGLMTMLMSGQRGYARGVNQVEAQQAVRMAIARMAQEIRESGYNPREVPAISTFTAASATSFAIQNDWNGNGVIETGITVNDPVKGFPRGERVTYTVTGTTLTRQESAVDGAPLVLIGGLQAMTFSYRDAADAVTATPANIRSIVITATVGEQSSPSVLDHVGVQMQVRVRVRNQ
jgi:prepilin-type N-terminal cleavage/methylation domain-containing protein